MKNLEANGGENSGRVCGPGPLRHVKRSRLALLAVASLFGSIFMAGCTTDEPKGGNGLSDFEYRILYPREYYDSADRWTRYQMDEENAALARRSK
jgi:hypothetical protein